MRRAALGLAIANTSLAFVPTLVCGTSHARPGPALGTPVLEFFWPSALAISLIPGRAQGSKLFRSKPGLVSCMSNAATTPSHCVRTSCRHRRHTGPGVSSISSYSAAGSEAHDTSPRCTMPMPSIRCKARPRSGSQKRPTVFLR